jgi:hypothetical protein
MRESSPKVLSQKQLLELFRRASRRYRPSPVRMLFIAEAPPAYQANRFFYFKDLRCGDTLFLELMKVLYPIKAGFAEGAFQSRFSAKVLRTRKEEFLRLFQHDGYYLIDASPRPLPINFEGKAKQHLLERALPGLLRQVGRLIYETRTPIVLIGGITYSVCLGPLLQEGFTVLNSEMINHPARGGQRLFRAKLSALLSDHAKS